MLYLPKSFSGRPEEATALMQAFPFATLIFADSGKVLVSHLPLLLTETSNNLILEGHFARANPQARALLAAAAPHVTAIFHGPHAYVTPKWYADHDVPTWNYAVVHAHGRLRLVEEAKALKALLARSAAFFEAPSQDPWRFDLPDDLADDTTLTRAIAGFVIEDLAISAKLKLSQNRSEQDQRQVAAKLAESVDPMDRAVAALMTDLQAGRPTQPRPLR